MKGLTERQSEVLAFIQDFVAAHKYPPTIREISTHFSISVKGAYDHVRALKRKGSIRYSNNHSRTIEVAREDEDRKGMLVKVPILGRVAAGKPLFAEENFDGHVSVPESYLKAAKYFALLVQGDSMVDAGVINGDVAVIRQQQTASNGDIVVAMIDEAVTLKRYFREANRVRLKSENSAYPPIYTTSARVLGKLACIIRSYE
jgi:repressor LexA